MPKNFSSGIAVLTISGCPDSLTVGTTSLVKTCHIFLLSVVVVASASVLFSSQNAESDAIRALPSSVTLDVSADKMGTLNVYLPEGEGPFPAVLLFGVGSGVPQVVWEMLGVGWAVITLDAGSLSEEPDDGMGTAALSWVENNAEKYLLDGEAIVLAGVGAAAQQVVVLAGESTGPRIVGVLLIEPPVADLDLSALTEGQLVYLFAPDTGGGAADVPLSASDGSRRRSGDVWVDEAGDNGVLLRTFLLSAKLSHW